MIEKIPLYEWEITKYWDTVITTKLHELIDSHNEEIKKRERLEKAISYLAGTTETGGWTGLQDRINLILEGKIDV